MPSTTRKAGGVAYLGKNCNNKVNSMKSIHTPIAFLAALLLFVLPTSGIAAQITISDDPECRIDIKGQIERGDFLALLEFENYLIVNNGESTRQSVICLDSLGGDVKSGLAIATFILEKGVSTRLQQNAECYSICAIMFMMGNYRGAEVRGLSRRMHVTASLGFHRPYLSLQEAALYSSGDIEDSYEFGVTSIFDILTLANQPAPWSTARMIEPDLMLRITGTPGDEIFLVTTVEEALRWNIQIDGIPAPQNIDTSHLLFACENALATQHQLTTELAGRGLLTEKIFDFSPLNSNSIKQVVAGARWIPQSETYQISSLRSGYSSIGCEVALSDQSVSVCGYDEATDTRIGNCGERYGRRGISQLALYHPATELLALTLVTGNAPEAAALRRCRVFDQSGVLIDTDICLQEVILLSDGSDQRAQHLITWPSGARTMIEIGATDPETVPTFRINGSLGRPVSLPNLPNCIKNSVSGNTFCVSN